MCNSDYLGAVDLPDEEQPGYPKENVREERRPEWCDHLGLSQCTTYGDKAPEDEAEEDGYAEAEGGSGAGGADCQGSAKKNDDEVR